jgi:hypothetical protein
MGLREIMGLIFARRGAETKRPRMATMAMIIAAILRGLRWWRTLREDECEGMSQDEQHMRK